jgi:predicted amidohydrolase YtcJ
MTEPHQPAQRARDNRPPDGASWLPNDGPNDGQNPVDMVVLDANLLTMDPRKPRAEALAVHAGRIAAVGDSAQVERLAGPGTAVVRLAGQTVVPGFVDPHTHFTMSILEPLSVDCGTPPHETVRDVLDALAAAAAATAPGRWIRGWGYRTRVVREGRAPSRRELDDAVPANPAFVVDGSVHCAYANSAALHRAGIHRDTPDPPHGRILRGPAGEPDGTLWEAAWNPLFTLHLRAELDALGDDVRGLVEAAARRHLALGITSVADALVVPEAAAMYRQADAAGSLPTVLHQMLGGDAFFDRPDRVLSGDVADGNVSDRLRGGTLKLFMDPMFPSAARIRFHPDGTEERFGERFYTQDEANEIVLAAHRRGLQVAIHCLGTWSIEQALTAVEHALRAEPAEDARFRIEHFTTPTGAQIRRALALGVVPVVQPPYMLARAGGGSLLADLGGDVRLHPYRTMLEAGVPVAGSSDYPCAPLNPMLGVGVLVNRRGRSGDAMGPEEAIAPMDALRMYTRHGAIAMRRDHEVGSLEPGKRADLAVLSDDPTAVAPDSIADIVVRQTWVDGKLLYERSLPAEPAAARS